MKKILLWMLFSLAALESGAQTGEPVSSEQKEGITLEEVCLLVEENYPFLGKYDVIESDRKLDVFKSKQNYIPNVKLKGNVSYQTEVITFPEMVYDVMGMDELRKDQYSVVLEITQRIWDGGQTKAEKSIANSSAETRRRELEVELFNLKENVTNMYFTVLLVDKAIEQAGIYVSYLEEMEKMMQSGFEKGIFSNVDLSKLKVSRIEAEQSRRELLLKREMLVSTLSDLAGRDLSGSEFLTPAPVQLQMSSDFSSRPEYALFDAQRKLASSQLEMLEVARMPQFALFLQGGYGYPGYDFLNDEFHPYAMAGIRISWDLNSFFFTRKAKNLMAYSAERNIEMAENAFRRQMVRQVIEQNSEITRLSDLVRDDEQIMGLRRSIRISSEDKFEKGIITVTELLEDINNENAASLNKMIHEMELLKTRYQLKYTMNQ